MQRLVLFVLLITTVICQDQAGEPQKILPWRKTTDFRGAYKGESRYPGGVKWVLKLGTTTTIPKYDQTTKSPSQEVVVSQYNPQRIGLPVEPIVLPALPIARPSPPTLPPLPSRRYLPLPDEPSRQYLPIV
uniref:Uncharacterized protein n=1 Tax=Bracon brevicornis TaxID=1563983 RepID=A0A6V7J938_9HYME